MPARFLSSMNKYILSGIAALALSGCGKDPEANRSVKASASASSQLEKKANEAPKRKSPEANEVSLGYEYHGYDMLKAVTVDIGDSVRASWEKYAPVFVTINGSGQETQISVEQGGHTFRYDLKSPLHPAGKEFLVYGRDPATREICILHRASLNNLLPETRRR